MRVDQQAAHVVLHGHISLFLQLHFHLDELQLDGLEVENVPPEQLENGFLPIVLILIQAAESTQPQRLSEVGVSHDLRLFGPPFAELLGCLLFAKVEVALQGVLPHIVPKPHNLLQLVLLCGVLLLALPVAA